MASIMETLDPSENLMGSNAFSAGMITSIQVGM